MSKKPHTPLSRAEQPPTLAPNDPAAETIIATRSALLRPNVLLSCGHYTNVGQKRKQNQDSLLTMQGVRVNLSDSFPLGLYVVADGMGGQASGEIASGLVVATLAHRAQSLLFKHFAEDDIADNQIVVWLREAVEAANAAVMQGRVARSNDMGSTVVAAVVVDTSAFIVHVGDSRAYRLNLDGELERLTLDHSLVEQLVLARQISAE